MGILAVQMKQPSASLPHFLKALEANPTDEQHWISYIDALFQANQLESAREVLAIAQQQGLQSDDLETLAVLLESDAQITEQSNAEYQLAFKESLPVSSATLQNNKKKTKTKPNKSTRKSSMHKGKDPSPQEINKLMTLLSEGRLTEAVTLAKIMTERFPLYGFGWKVLGGVLKQINQNADALIPMQKAVALLPGDAEAHSNLSTLLRELGQLNEAEASCRRALGITPDFAEAHNNLGTILLSLGRFDEAESSYRRALEIKPNYVNVYCGLGSTLKSLGRLNEAETCFRRALEIKPNHVMAHSNLIFALDLMIDRDASSLLEERIRWDATHAAHLLKPQTHTNIPDPERRIRIGYVSADFREHSAAKVFGGMLTRYDRSQFEVFAYANIREKNDKFTELFKQNVTAWRSIISLSDDTVAKMIQEDQIDVLVDLSGYTAGNRLLVFARKPAPIQITAWGYATGTGMQAMDVFFADPVVVPPQEKHYFIEEVRYLPNVVGSFFTEPFPAVNELPALSDGIVTFGSFNRLDKISAEAYRAWAEILLAVPRSRLILKTNALADPKTRESIIGHFTKVGVAADRIIMQGKTSWHEHVQAYNQIDIALDPFPHGGGVTSLECLMMGVPVMTLRWPTIAGRLSASIMTTLGLTDWIAETPKEYVELAAKKATDLQSLATLRQQQRGIFTASVIGDQAAYARAVEQEYRQLWREWCARL